MKKALLAALAATLLACSKEPPPKPDDGPKKTTPVPSDMVFNDFVPPSGAGGGIVGVKTDGGLEAGADLGTASTGDGGAGGGAAAEEDGPGKLKVTDPGAEPRVARRYAFVANKSEKRIVTSTNSADQGGGAPPQEMAFALTGDFVAKQVKPTGARFEMKVLGLDVPGVPAAQKAQAAAQLAAFKGLTAQFEISNRGEVGEVDFKADERMQAAGAEVIIQSLQQALELLAPPLPDAPIGVGAKWERKVDRKERGISSSTKHSFVLKEMGEGGGVITADIEIAVPKRPLQQRGVPPGATEEVSGKGSYTYAFKLDRIATKADGEMHITTKIEVPDPKDPKGGKKAMAQNIKLKVLLEVPK